MRCSLSATVSRPLLVLPLFLFLIACNPKPAQRDSAGTPPAASDRREPAPVAPATNVPLPSDSLIAASFEGNHDAVRNALAQGADVNTKRGDGCTPLHAAAASDHLEIARLLIERGARLDEHEKLNGFTPLHWAVFRGSVSMVELLLSSGVDPNARDKSGHTPLVLARTMQISTKIENFSDIAAMLQQSGAIDNSRTSNLAGEAIRHLLNDFDVEAGPKFGSLARQIVREGKVAIPLLIAVIQDRSASPQKRNNAAFALSKIRPVTSATVDAFVYVLGEEALDDRRGDYVGFMAENRILSDAAGPALAACLDDRRAEVRVNALSALIVGGLVGHVSEEKLLALCLRDPAPVVRLNAILSCGQSGAAKPATAQVLRGIATDNSEDRRIRAAANQSLRKLGLEVAP